jgi:hypothetical protein
MKEFDIAKPPETNIVKIENLDLTVHSCFVQGEETMHYQFGTIAATEDSYYADLVLVGNNWYYIQDLFSDLFIKAIDRELNAQLKG